MKKYLALALALLMVCVMLPVTALAATALPEAQDGVIKLTEDVNLEAMAVVGAAGSNLTLDLNGCTITATGTALDVYGTLKVIDSSDAKTGKVVSTAKNAMWINDNTKVTMEAGTFEGNEYGIVVAGKNAEFTMNGGAAKGVLGSGISGNGNETNGTPDYAPTIININGGEITGADTGIYHPQIGTLNINGGSISGASGIEMRAGTLNVTGGTITATAGSVTVSENGNGPTTAGAAIAVSQHTTKHEITVNVNGGVLTGAAAINEANPENNSEADTDKIDINVNGGNLTGEIKKASSADLTISGGKLTNAGDVTKYLENGKTIDQNGNVVNTATVRVPESETTTTPAGNPSTGAAENTGIAAAMVVVALLGSAAALRK